MYFLINKKKRIIFAWSAKCACTHVKKMFCYYSDISIPNDKIHDISFDFLPDDCTNYVIILFIRDPYKRLVSGFINKYIFENYPFYNTNKELTFYNFVNELTTNQFKNINCHHFTPQLSEAYNENIKFDKIFDIENIDYEFLNTLFNKKLPRKIKEYRGDHTTQYNPFQKNLNIYNMNKIDLKNMKSNIPTYEFFFNKELKTKVYTFYKKDFDFFKKHGFYYNFKLKKTFIDILKKIIIYHIFGQLMISFIMLIITDDLDSPSDLDKLLSYHKLQNVKDFLQITN
jgi:hypothetical protein